MINIIPKVGIANVELNMKRLDVMKILQNQGYSNNATICNRWMNFDSFADSRIKVHYDSTDRVMLIELANTIKEIKSVMMMDIRVFDEDAAIVLRKVSEISTYISNEQSKAYYSFTFPDLGIILWNSFPVLGNVNDNSNSEQTNEFESIGVARADYIDMNYQII